MTPPVRSTETDPLRDRDRLRELLFTENLSDADGTYYLDVVEQLRAAIHRAYFNLDPAMTHDVAVDALIRARRAASNGTLDMNGNLAGYLVRAAKNGVIDILRTQWARNAPVSVDASVMENVALSDDDVARLVERRATVEMFAVVLQRARHAGDVTVFRLVTYLLDQADQTGQVPSNRAAAAALGLSHTGVAKALARVRELLSEVIDE
jgi:DNA-directed RNA polymerase specialized sigma24 family protein